MVIPLPLVQIHQPSSAPRSKAVVEILSAWFRLIIHPYNLRILIIVSVTTLSCGTCHRHTKCSQKALLLDCEVIGLGKVKENTGSCQNCQEHINSTFLAIFGVEKWERIREKVGRSTFTITQWLASHSFSTTSTPLPARRTPALNATVFSSPLAN
ncbi:mary1-like reverse transcriptase [Moniliophthora roreri]|nr:mary1-like reverse transcriptase [Moniliophthora roreri]